MEQKPRRKSTSQRPGTELPSRVREGGGTASSECSPALLPWRLGPRKLEASLPPWVSSWLWSRRDEHYLGLRSWAGEMGRSPMRSFRRRNGRWLQHGSKREPLGASS